MKTFFAVLLVSLSLGITGCSSSFSARKAQDVTPAFLVSIRQTFTTDHIAYMGSDGSFHYFSHSKLFGGGPYKVAKDRMKMVFPAEFTLGTQKPAGLFGRFDEATSSWMHWRSKENQPTQPPAPTATGGRGSS